jgi:hypothetical protein
MKITFKIFVSLMTLTLTLSLSAFAEEYKAPDLKLKKIDNKKMKTTVKTGNWESGLSYKVEDKATNERAVASDQENSVKPMPSRDPSSSGKAEVENDGEVHMWKFEDIEQHP